MRKHHPLVSDAPSALVPVLEEIGGRGPMRVRRVVGGYGVLVCQWDRVRTGRPTIADHAAAEPAAREPSPRRASTDE